MEKNIMLYVDLWCTLHSDHCTKVYTTTEKDKWKCHKHSNIYGVASRQPKTAGETIRESASLLGKGKKRRATRGNYKIITNMEDVEKWKYSPLFTWALEAL